MCGKMRALNNRQEAFFASAELFQLPYTAAVFCRDAYLRGGKGKAEVPPTTGAFCLKQYVSITDSTVELGSNLGLGPITTRCGRYIYIPLRSKGLNAYSNFPQYLQRDMKQKTVRFRLVAMVFLSAFHKQDNTVVGVYKS
jgi:hypothetical protein